MRAVAHFMRVQLGEVDEQTALSTSEMCMKPLCIRWLSEWGEGDDLVHLVRKSWKMAMDPAAQDDDQLGAEPSMTFHLGGPATQGRTSPKGSHTLPLSCRFPQFIIIKCGSFIIGAWP